MVSSDKILSRNQWKTWPLRMKKQKKKIVFTNGCFDVLHHGHVKLLEWARAQGDCLIVALNSNASIKRLKGNGRPIFSYLKRASVVAALGCVDAVCCFSQNTPRQIIDIIRPDILVKGGDYKQREIVGKESVEKSGGKVLVFPFVPGVSTSKILKASSKIQ